MEKQFHQTIKIGTIRRTETCSVEKSDGTFNLSVIARIDGLATKPQLSLPL